MIKIVKRFYKTKVGRVLLHPLKPVYNFIRYRTLPPRMFVSIQYYKVFSRFPDLKNPVLFTEKIQWLKLNDHNPLLTICADKFAVRKHIEDTVGENYLIPLVLDTANPEDIKPENLPDYPVIIKTNHNSGIGGGGVVKDKFNFDYTSARKNLREKLKENYYHQGKEWEYKNIKARIIVERLMTDSTGNTLLNDYKIHCFHGQPMFIQTLFDREEDLKETWYDVDWNIREVYYVSEKKKELEKPQSLEEMLAVARKLSKDFPYVRVDLYDVKGRVYFGELTFRPYAGFMKFKPQEWDMRLGKLLKLPVNE